ncbi:hypothetical protein [Gordonia terrae]
MNAPTQPRPGSVAPRRHSLLDVVSVVANAPAGDWSRGPIVDEYVDRASGTVVTDICDPSYPLPEIPDVALGDERRPFAVIQYAHNVPTRCIGADELIAAAGPTLARSVEYRVGKYLWEGGVNTDEAHLLHTDITTVDRTGNYNTDVAAALHAAYAAKPWIRPILLLGFESALTLGIALGNIDVRWAVSPAIPQDAIAVIGDEVTVTLGIPETNHRVISETNRHQIETTQLVSLGFDITKAVRVAA